MVLGTPYNVCYVRNNQIPRSSAIIKKGTHAEKWDNEPRAISTVIITFILLAKQHHTHFQNTDYYSLQSYSAIHLFKLKTQHWKTIFKAAGSQKTFFLALVLLAPADDVDDNAIMIDN